MKIKKSDILIITAAILLPAAIVRAQSAREIVEQGNALYADANYSEAVTKYDEALTETPATLEPVFNKADSLYRMDDFAGATELYNSVAAESMDMKLVNAARYNNGNSFFQRGMQKRQSKPKEAVEDMKTAVSYWRKVLDAEPENEKAARNIEVARLTIKDILEQPQDPNQQQDPNQPQDPNQQQDPNQPQDPNQQQKNQQQQNDPNQQQQQNEPNQPQDPNQQQQQQQNDPNQAQDPNQQQQPQQADKNKDEPPPTPPEQDSVAQEILDREQKLKEQRRRLKISGYKKVEKDW